MATPVEEPEHSSPPPADLAEESQKLHDSLRDERDQHLRTLADFKNYRRRVERDGSKVAEQGKRDVMLPLLDIIDDLEKTLYCTNDGGRNLVEGVRIIHQKLLALLEAQGVCPFDSVGEPFTPHLHEAVAVAECSEIASGTVVDDLRRGYCLRDELLRPAQVRVAR